jgi:hypothetical protein
MADDKVVEKMNQYLAARKEVESLEAEKKKLVDQAMPADVKKKVADIEAEFAGKVEAANEKLAKQEEEIKEGVVALQKNVSVAGLKVTYHKGRVTWDAKGLEELAESKPDIGLLILPLKKQGKDYASFKLD